MGDDRVRLQTGAMPDTSNRQTPGAGRHLADARGGAKDGADSARAELVAGLRRLADLLAERHDLPVDAGIRASTYPVGTDDEQYAEVDRIARALSVDATWNDARTHYRVMYHLGGQVYYQALHITEEAMARHRASTSYLGAVTP